MGLALSLAFGSGCSDSNSGKTDGSTRRETGGNRDTASNPNADGAGPCDIFGTTYPVGQSVTVNCVRYTCQGNDNVTSSGTACTDTGPAVADTRPAPDASPPPADVAPPVDGGPPVDTGGGRDVAPGEAGKRDSLPPVDTGAVDGGEREDTPPDLTPVGKDTAPPADVANPVTCSYGGRNYNPGDEFPCDCNTCICTSSGGIRSLTSVVCGVDAE
jgi:hypothetical protein